MRKSLALIVVAVILFTIGLLFFGKNESSKSKLNVSYSRFDNLKEWVQALRQSDLGDGKRAGLADRLENESLVFQPIEIGIQPIRGPNVDSETPVRVVPLLPIDSKISKFWEEKVNSDPVTYYRNLDALVLNQLPSNEDEGITALEKALESQKAQK